MFPPGDPSAKGLALLIRRRSTLAWPLTWAYVALVVYASLYPFGPWRDQGLSTWSFLAAPWPKYWGAFDVWANIWGYGPLGFLAALSAMRMGLRRQAGWLAVLGSAALSLLMEGLQSYLPVRVPSVADFGLNTCGAALGALLASGLESMGAIDRWSRFRERWFTEDAAGGMALLVLWPSALLFPVPICLGVGQIGPNLRTDLAQWLRDSPLGDWLSFQDPPTQVLTPELEFALVLMGLLLPCLLGFSVIRDLGQKLVLAVLAFGVGMGVSALSAVLTYGPGHAWVWLDAAQAWALLAGLAVALVLAALPRWTHVGLLWVGLWVYLWAINQAPASTYVTLNLQQWEQGRFVRFNGLAQWLGWVWPFAVWFWALLWMARPSGERKLF